MLQIYVKMKEDYQRAVEENSHLQQQIKSTNEDYRRRLWKYVQDIAVCLLTLICKHLNIIVAMGAGKGLCEKRFPRPSKRSVSSAIQPILTEGRRVSPQASNM